MKMQVRAIFCLLLILGGVRVQAQYQLLELGIHGGVGGKTLIGSTAAIPGPGGHLAFTYTFFPCGKAFGFEGRGAWSYGQSTLGDGSTALNVPLAGKTTLRWTGPEAGAMFKVRLHEKHRPKEFAFVFGPKVAFPLLAWYKSESGSGSVSNTELSVNRILPLGVLAVQVRRPAPEKKSWFFEPGIEFMPTQIFKREDAFRASGLYIYLQFGYAFWDQRG